MMPVHTCTNCVSSQLFNMSASATFRNFTQPDLLVVSLNSSYLWPMLNEFLISHTHVIIEWSRLIFVCEWLHCKWQPRFHQELIRLGSHRLQVHCVRLSERLCKHTSYLIWHNRMVSMEWLASRGSSFQFLSQLALSWWKICWNRNKSKTASLLSALTRATDLAIWTWGRTSHALIHRYIGIRSNHTLSFGSFRSMATRSTR